MVALAETPRAVCFVGVGPAARTSAMAGGGRHGRGGGRVPVPRMPAAGGAATERRRKGRRLAMATVDEEDAIRAAALADVRDQRTHSKR